MATSLLRHVRLLSLKSRSSLPCSFKLSDSFEQTQSRSKRCYHATSLQNTRTVRIYDRHWAAQLSLLPTSSRPCGLQQRNNSTETSQGSDVASEDLDTFSYIPEPPSLPSYNVSEYPLNALGEPTLQSMDLGNMWPTGLYQQALEFLHVEGLSWFGGIVVTTIVIRLMLFPLNVVVQKYAANMYNNAPQMQILQQNLMKAQAGGNIIEMKRYSEQLAKLMKEKQIEPWKNFVVLLGQLPIFLTVFTGLRRMCYLPVESMKDGGLWWFTDLTTPDPYFILPVFTACTMLVILEIGSETGVKADNMNKNIKKVMRILPFVTLVLISKFPAAMCCYWATSNSISLCMTVLFKFKAVRTFFDIPERKQNVKLKPITQVLKTGVVGTVKQGIRLSDKLNEYEARKSVGATTAFKTKPSDREQSG